MRRPPGIAQDEAQASYAGFIEPQFRRVDWTLTAREIHHHVRMFAFIGCASAPLADVDGRWLKVFRTRLQPGAGLRVECTDAPIWIVDLRPADPPVNDQDEW